MPREKGAKIYNPLFPREYARTLNYTLGAPRTFRVTRDGKRVFFLRSTSSSEKTLDLWYLDMREKEPEKAKESLLIRFSDLEHHDVMSRPDPESERVRKERLREAAGGITTYAISALGDIVAFTVSGDVYVTYVSGTFQTIFAPVGDATDLKLCPNGKFISYVSGRELFVAKLTKSKILRPVRISPRSSDTQAWGSAEFIAAEEMHRYEGHWWSSDSNSIIFTGVDEATVPIWYISNPTDPASAPRAIRYPQAGTENARISLFLWSRGKNLREIKWVREEFPYLVAVRWRKIEPTIVVQDRSQRSVIVLTVNQKTGQTLQIYEKHDKLWVELIRGVPAWSDGGEIIDAPDAETRRLRLGGKIVSRSSLEVRKFVGQLSSRGLVFLASEDPKETHVWICYPDKTHTKLSKRPGVFDAEVGGNTVVVFGADLGDKPNNAEVLITPGTDSKKAIIRSISAERTIRPRPIFFRTPRHAIDYAILYPRNFRRDRMLPILMDPYGGPWVQRCIRSSHSFTISQWFANQGFAVIVADGRGTPGRGRRWEKAVSGNLIRPVLEDQIAVIDDAINTNTFLDPSKVAIRGWSFGGYLAALSVLLRPDRFHAAIAGAPVTDWRYYDTHYAERYLGDPTLNSQQYDSCSAIIAASRLTRPLLLIHGLNDDNVISAHTLRLSQALFEAGREHCVLPLTGITHMAASQASAEKLLHAELRFLRSAIAML